ncbi:MAG: oligosaccharide flippase family protein [Candidatus Moraniibacteriota bacterium]
MKIKIEQTIKQIKNFFKTDFLRNSVVVFTGSLMIGVLNYVFHIILGRMVEVEVYGEAESLLAIFSIFSILFLSIGTISAKCHSIYKAENNQAYSYYLTLLFRKKIFIPALGMVLGGIFVSPLLADFLKIEHVLPIVFIWVAVFIFIFVAINNGVLRGWQMFSEFRLLGIFRAFAKLLSVILLLKLGFSLGGVTGSLVISALATFVLSVFLIRNYRSCYLKTAKKEIKKINLNPSFLKKYALSVLVGNLAINILINVDMVMAKHNLSALEAGQYGALMIAGKIIFFMTNSLIPVIFSMSAANYHKNKKTSHFLKYASIILFLIVLTSCFAYFLFPKIILGILFSGKYLGAYNYLGWVGVQASLFSFANLFYHYLISLDNKKISYVFVILALFLSITLLLFGDSIKSIIFINVFFQLLAVAIAGVFIFKSNSYNN